MSKIILKDFINNNDDVKMETSGLEFKLNNKYTPLTWENAKKDKNFLIKYNKFRKEYVDTLLNEILEKLNCKPECYYIAAGSASMDSDYDITIYSKISNRIVDLFNDSFISKFKRSSDKAFDTNLYGTSFFHAGTMSNYDYAIKDPSKKCNPENFVYYINLENNEIDIRNQRVWAFIKLFMQINKLKGDYEIIRNSLIEYIKGYDTIKEDVKRALIKLNKLNKTRSNYSIELKKYSYIKYLFESADKKDDTLAIQLKEQISKTNFYGVETYFTQGAVNHVVGKIQLNFKKLNISKNEYIDSLIENLGDFIKEYAHYPEDYIEFTTHASKYIIRIFDAIKNISKNNKDADKIIKIARKLRKLRGTKKEKEILKELKKLQKILNYSDHHPISVVLFLLDYTLNVINKNYV